MIRVAVAAQAVALRLGLRALLQAGEAVEVIAEAASLAELGMPDSEIDVMVLAISHLPDDLGEILDVLGSPEHSPAVLLLIEEGHIPPSLAAWAGVWGVLPLDASADELQAAVAALKQGLIVVSSPLAGNGLPRLLGSPTGEAEPLVEPLTDRELEVLGWLAQGLPNKQIAAALSISEHTVKFHISAIYSKLGATNRTEAVRRGVQQGLVVL